MSKGEPAANQSFTSHIFCFPAPFYKDLRLAQRGESTYLIWAIFDNLFHFTQHTILILMSYAVSVHLASPFFHINSLHYRELDEQDKEENLPGWNSVKSVRAQTRTQQRQAGFSPPGTIRTDGGKCLPRLFKVQSTQYDVN